MLPRLDSETAALLQRTDSLALSGGSFRLPNLDSLDGPPSTGATSGSLARQLSWDPLRTMGSFGGSGPPSSDGLGFAAPAPKRAHLAGPDSALHTVRHTAFKHERGAAQPRVRGRGSARARVRRDAPGGCCARRPGAAPGTVLREGGPLTSTPRRCLSPGRHLAVSPGLSLPACLPLRQAEPDAAFAELKHADHRRLLSRWGKALFRYAGIKRDDFARRQGSYRENFTNVLQVCFGSCFDGPGSYWYDHSHSGAFAAALLYCATSGRVRVSETDAYALFVKKEPDRAASSWQVNNAQLATWGVAPAELVALFRGPARVEHGFPRGTPLLVPPMDALPPPAPGVVPAGAVPAAGTASLAPAASGGWPLAMGPPPAGAVARTFSELASLSQPLVSAPSLPVMPFSGIPLQRQSTVATLAVLMAQNDYMERQQGKPLDRSFSDGARAFMAAIAGGYASGPAGAAPTDADGDVVLGSAAPLWARNSVGQR